MLKYLRVIIALFFILESANAFAGAANAHLNCKSKDNTEIKGEIPGDFTTFELCLSKESKELRLFSALDPDTGKIKENASINIIEDFKKGVWTLYVVTISKASSHEGSLKMYAIPQTVKFKVTSGGYHTTFNAKAEYDFDHPDLKSSKTSFSCSLDYSI